MKKKKNNLNEIKKKNNSTLKNLEKTKSLDKKTLSNTINEISGIKNDSALQQESIFKTTLYSIGDAVITTDVNGKIQQMNKVAEKLCGWKESEAKNKSLESVFKIINEITGVKSDSPIKRVLKSGHTMGLANHTMLISKNGKQIPVADSSAPIKNDNGKIVGVVIVFRDQTCEREKQNALEERERKYSTLVSNLPGFIYRCANDKNWTMEFISDGCKNITGYSPNDFIKNNKLAFNDIIHPDYQKEIWKKWQKILKDRSFFEYEYPIITKNGKQKWVWERGRGIYSNSGKLLFLEGFIEDISERRITEESLRLKNIVFESSIAANSIANLEGKIIDANLAFLELWDFSDKSQVLGKPLTFFIKNKNDVDIILKSLNKMGVWEGDFIAKRNNRTGFIAHAVATTVIDNKGKIIGYQSAVLDITHKSKTEEKLKESEQRYKSFFDNAPDAIFLADPDTGKIIDANKAAVDLINIPYSKIISMHQTQLHPKRFESYSSKTFKRHKKVSNLKIPVENFIVTSTGEEVPVEVLASKLKLNGKNVIQGVFRNISERRKIEKALQESENKFQLFFEHSKDAMLLLDGKVFFDCNKAAVEMLGYSNKSQLLAVHPSKLSPDFQPDGTSSFTKAEKIMDQAFKDGFIRFEWIHKKMNGEDLAVEVMLTSIPLEGKQILFTIWRDISERKIAEKKLEESEELFRLIAENSTDMISRHDVNGKYLYASPSCYSILGYHPNELIGKSAFDFIMQEDIPVVAAALTNLLQSSDSVSITFRGTHKNGNFIWLESNSRIVSNPDKAGIFEIQVSIREITKRKQAEAELLSSEISYRGLFNSVSEAIYILDENGIFIDVNQGALDMYGYDRNELIGKSPEYVSASNKNDLNSVATALGKAFNGEKQQFEFWGKRKNGEEFLKDVRLYPGTYQNKRVCIAIANDITEKRKIENALASSEERYRAISNLTSDYLFSTEADENGVHKVVWIAGSFEKITGYSIEEYKRIGGWRATLHPEELELDDLDLELLKRNKKVTREIRTYHKDGSLVWVKSSAQPIWDYSSNKLIGVYGAVSDITESKQNEETMRLMANMLDTAPNSITVHDYDGNILYANKSTFEMHNYTQEEFNKLNLKELDVPESASLISERMKVIQKLGSANFEVQHFRKDKSRLPLEVHVKNVMWAGKPAFLSVSTDITERKHAEEMLQESEQRYNTFINSHIDLMFVKDENFKYVVANEATLKFFNKTREELLNKTDFELMDFESAKNCELSDLKALANNSAVVSEELTANLVFETTKFPLKLKNNKIGLGGIIRDITERKRSEVLLNIQSKIAEATINSKHLNELFEIVRIELSKIIDVRNFFIALYDENTGLLRSDIDKDEVEEISEWHAKGSMTGYVIEQKKALILTKNEINKLISTGQAGMIGVIPEIWLGVPFRIAGKVIGVLVVQNYKDPKAYDYTSLEILEIVAHELSIYIQHKKAEEETLKLSAAIVQSPTIVVITDPSGTIEYVNPKFCEITGYSLEEAKGKNPRILKSGLHKNKFYENVWSTILSGKIWQGEFQNRKKNGEVYWENALISPITDTDGKVTHFVAVKEDITDKKKMIEELIVAKEKAEEMNRIKSSFFANMSHELRTPMVGILGFSEVLMSELKDNPDYLHMISSINTSGQRLLETLNLILNLSKLEASKVVANLKTQDIIPILKESFGFFKSAADKKGIKYSFIAESTEILCDVDHLLFTSIFNNLINNAIKFTDDGSVTLKVDSNNKNVLISVIDTGVGISEEKQNLIWEEFRQASEGYNRSFEGTGLGLTIARKYTDIMHGTVSAKSTLGKGTTFEVSFPISKQIADTPIVENPNITINTIDPAKTLAKILYIEDDEISVKYVTTILKGLYSVDWAKDSDEAIDKAKQCKYEILLMDINLRRGMDGLELTKVIRKMENYKSTPIVAITAFAMGREKEEFLSKGMTHYLSKPFVKNQLLSLLDSLRDKK